MNQSLSTITAPDSVELGSALIERQKRVGLRFLLGVISSLFFLFLIALISRSQFGDWLALADPNGPVLASRQLWFNTIMLALGSISLEFAYRVFTSSPIKAGVLLGGVFAGLFVAGQLYVWSELVSWGYVAAANPALGFFYMLTGIHGLHLLGGMVAWLFLAVKAFTTPVPSSLKNSIRLCATYWHYLLALWLVLFAVFTSTPDTYRAIAEFCGLGY